MELMLIGNIYRGRFVAERKEKKYRYVDDTHERTSIWWEGQGLILENKTEEERFLFRTPEKSQSLSLRDSLICFESAYAGIPNMPEILNHESTTDLLLKQMYEDVREKEKNVETIIPEIIVRPLNIERLAEEGLLAR